METKIQILNGDQLQYMNLEEFISIVSSKLSDSNEHPKYDEKDILKTKDVCKILSISVPTVSDWAEKGEYEKHRLQGRVFYLKSEIMAALSRKQKA